MALFSQALETPRKPRCTRRYLAACASHVPCNITANPEMGKLERMHQPAGGASPEPKALRRATELPVPQAAAGCGRSGRPLASNSQPGLYREETNSFELDPAVFRIGGIQPRLHVKKTRIRPYWTSPTGSRLEGHQARLNFKPRARPSPNFAPAWSRQVYKTNKKTGTRSEFERTLHP